MAIIITDQFQLRQKNFLDDRQGIASSVSALKSWNYSTVPIPEGFEVYVGGVWYIYRSSHTEDPVTGKFRTRTESDGVDDLKVRVTRLEFEDGRDVASTFAQIKTDAFWRDSTGVSHARAGRIVTVTNDGANNGPWYLISSDYTRTENWIKLISRGDLVTTTGGASVSDTSVYTSSKTNSLFPKKASTENITAKWIFKEDQVFEKDLTTKTLHATTGTIANLSSSSGTITNLNSTTGNISDLTSNTANISNGTITNLESTNSTTTNQTVTGKLQTTGQSVLKEVNVGTNGSIKDEDGKTVARVDKIIAEESEITDLDQHIRDQVGFIGVGNLLKNTSFFGQFKSKDMGTNTGLGGDVTVYNSRVDDWGVTSEWEIVEDSDSLTGYSMRLKWSTSMISQETLLSLNVGSSYILSWKQKGTISVEIQGYDLDIKTIQQTSRYKTCYAKIVPTANRKERIYFKGGPGNIFEVKFEEGLIPSTWFPSCMDTDPVASLVNSYEYLKTTFLDCPNRMGDCTTTNVFLKNQIKVGEVVNDGVQNIYGGLSGLIDDDKDVMVWSGSTYENAIDLLSKVEADDSYLDTLNKSTLKNLTKAIITLNYKSIFTDLYAVGKFKGQHLDEDGIEMRSFKGITGFLPDSSGNAIGFSGGRLNRVDGSYPTSIDFGGTTINFNAGLCTSPEGQYTINTGSYISGVTSLHLIFHKGFLVKVSSVKDYNTTYYWY